MIGNYHYVILLDLTISYSLIYYLSELLRKAISLAEST